MPHISKRYLNKNVEKELLDSFEYILNHSKSSDLRIILSSLMTPIERLMIAKRLGIAVLLNEGLTDVSIDNTLKVTRSTVNKVELVMENKPEGFQLAIKKYKQRILKEEAKTFLIKVANDYVIPAAFGRTPKIKV